MIGVGNFVFQILSFIVPALIVIVALKIVAAATKGYKNFLDAITVVFSSWKTLFFFVVIVFVFIYFWVQIKGIFGMV